MIRTSWKAAAILGLMAGAACQIGCQKVEPVKFETPYQAVLLVNGAVYFGKLEGWGTERPVLTDVFYVFAKTDPETKQVSNMLIKRGKEWHEPDRMYLNPAMVVFVEPVGRDSQVAKLIAQAAS